MKFAKKTDILIIFIIVVLSAAVILGYKYFIPKHDTYAEIYYKSELIEIIPLDGTIRTFTVPNSPSVKFTTYDDGSIAFTSSDCKDHICIKAGRLSYPGESAACLPNKVILKIISQNSDTDAVID